MRTEPDALARGGAHAEFRFCLVLALFAACSLCAQPQRNPNFPDDGPGFGGPPPGNFGGPGGRGNFGGPPMGVHENRKLVAQFDKDGDQRLNATERKAAREFLANEKSEGRGPRRFGPPRRNENSTPPEPGPKLSPADVKSFGKEPLYASNVLRTLFLQFENSDWEKELADFKGTDVEVPAKLTVDGKNYPDVGVHFRGASSFMMVGEGRKRSLNLSMDFAHDQRLLGYRTLDLLNSHEDATFLRTVLYARIAGEYLPTPKANFVRVVINGESWGVYVNAQQFNKDFTKEFFGSTKGARWKVPGSPRASGGLKYLGDDIAEYKKHYEIKTKDEPKSWADFIQLCKVLNQTPAAELEKKLSPLLDIDGALKFLALENVFINNDGYWIRTSDYSIYEDEKKRFHLVPHDFNEVFSIPEAPGRNFNPPGIPGPGAGLRVRGVELDPLFGADDPNKPLLNKLLAVPALRARYLGFVREITERWLDWEKIAPLAAQYQSLIAADVKTDTRKLESYDAFIKGVTEDTEEEGFRGPRRSIGLKTFFEQRRAFLLKYNAAQHETGGREQK